MKLIDQQKIEKIKRLAEEYLLENSPDTDPDYWIAYDIVELCEEKFSPDWEDDFFRLQKEYERLENELEEKIEGLTWTIQDLENELSVLNHELEDVQNDLAEAEEVILRTEKELKEDANQTTMYVLVGEQKGDYDDYYQRPEDVLATSKSKEKLIQYWEKLDCHSPPQWYEGQISRIIEDFTYISYYIVEIDKV